MMLSPERAEYEFYEYSTISGLSNNHVSNKKTLLEVRDVLGRKSSIVQNKPLFFIYSDGSVDKHMIIK